MKINLEINDKNYSFDLNAGIDLSLAVSDSDNGINAYFIPDPVFTTFEMGSFVGNVSKGGACNCETLTFNPHGNGTHTEGVGHISPRRISVNQCLKKYFFLAKLISISPEKQNNGDRLITESQLNKHLPIDYEFEALIVRTLPNEKSKKHARYSGTNPCYFESKATTLMEKTGLKHLLTDLPSVDREEDDGLLSAHKRFWTYPENPRMDATITELIYVPNTAPDGLYLLNLQVASIESDASPSRPVIYPLNIIS